MPSDPRVHARIASEVEQAESCVHLLLAALARIKEQLAAATAAQDELPVVDEGFRTRLLEADFSQLSFEDAGPAGFVEPVTFGDGDDGGRAK